MRRRQYGLTLIELLISVVLSLVLTLVLVQLHVHGTLLSQRQQTMEVHLENAAALVHQLTHGIRDALYRVDLSAAVLVSSEAGTAAAGIQCAGISVSAQCLPPMMSWIAPGNGAQRISSALSGTDVIQVKQNCCVDVIADQFYLARRGGVQSNPVSLYRRRMKTDGSYLAAVELVEGVSALTVRFIVHNSAGQLMLVDNTQVTDWWQLSAVRVQAQLKNPYVTDKLADLTEMTPFSFTVATRQWYQTADYSSSSGNNHALAH